MTDRAETEYEIRVRRAKLGYVSALSWRISARHNLPTQYNEVRSWWGPTERWAVGRARSGRNRREIRLTRMREQLRAERVVT